jgi:hypothetical protein
MFARAAVLGIVGCTTLFFAHPRAVAQESSPAAKASGSPGSTFQERLAVAATVKVGTSILGIQLDQRLEAAEKRLDGSVASTEVVAEEGKPEKEEQGEKILFKLKGTDYSTILLETDGAKRIKSITAMFRDGKGKAFRDLGEVDKAPVLSPTMVAWDVVRDKKHTRVVATGSDEKATTIKIFRIIHADPAKGWAAPERD